MRVACVVVPHFFVAAERRDDSALRGRPVVVGGAPEERKEVLDCSPEAMARGVRPGMSLREALSRCPEAAFVEAHPERYRAATRAMVTALLEIIPHVQPANPGVIYLEVPPTRPSKVLGGFAPQRPPVAVPEGKGGGNTKAPSPSMEEGWGGGQPPNPATLNPRPVQRNLAAARGAGSFEVEVARAITTVAEHASGLALRVGIADGKFAAYAAAVLEGES